MLPIQNIGLVGRAGSGKGVLAAELVKRGYTVVSFARPLKIKVGRMFLTDDTDAAAVLAWVGRHKDTLRTLLQAYGQACRDLYEPDYWVNMALGHIAYLNRRGESCVIDDVRFPNEVAALKTAGFTTFRIERPRWHRTLYGGPTLSGQHTDHISEQVEGLDVDRVLVNDTPPETLLRKLDHYMKVVNG